MKYISNSWTLFFVMLAVPCMGVSCSNYDNSVNIGEPLPIEEPLPVEEPLPAEINGKYVVEFNLNYEGAGMLDTLLVEKGRMMQASDRRQPTREGYRFAGWYTAKECQPEQEWLFGSKNGGFYPSVPLDSMPVNQSMRLYARWASPVSIKTAEQLDMIREDLNGWYVLDADIDLSAIADWEPIGSYESDYEMADGEWWKKAFKGRFDGQGHKITGLSLTTGQPTMKALFGTVANGDVCNLIIEDCRIDIESPSVYAAPLIAVIKKDGERQALVQNCEVRNARIKVHETVDQSIFSAVTGLIAGAWNGTIDHCTVSGNLEVILDGSGKDGELYVGGILGEGYSDTKCCSSSLDIKVDIQTKAALKVSIGGLQASATNIDNSMATGNVSIVANQDIAELYVGGLVGSERYGNIKNCAMQGNVSIQNASKVKVGGMLGEFNNTYGSIGMLFGITNTTLTNCYSSGIITTSDIAELSVGNISGVGQPETSTGWFGPGMSYTVADCAYLNQGLENAVDSAIESLKGFETITDMNGDSMKSILDSGHGAGQWNYEANTLPTPSKN